MFGDQNAAQRLIGQVLQQTYTLERLIGAGGMGAVFEASHRRLRRRFAVKMLFPGVAAVAEAVARFRREAEVTSDLGHPNIIEVIDFNHTDDGTPYIVMELLVGEDLSARLARVGRMELEATLAVVRQASSALTAAHGRGIIHRDLKPSNIFLSRQGDGSEVVKVVDFGISKVLGSQSVVTQTQATMGTPCYMSPEQADGRAAEVDARTDVFAIGTIVYEMFCGRPPFVGETIPSVLYKVCHTDPPRPRELRPDLPGAVEQVLLTALSKPPELRHASMADFTNALATAVGQEPAVGPPGPTLPPDGPAAMPDRALELPRTVSAHTEEAPPATADPLADSRSAAQPAAATTLSASSGQIAEATSRSVPRTTAVARRTFVFAGLATVGLAVVALLVALSSSSRDPTARIAPGAGAEVSPVDAGTGVAPVPDGDTVDASEVTVDRQQRLRVIASDGTEIVCRLRGTDDRAAGTTVAPCTFDVPRGTRVALVVSARGFASLVQRLQVDRDREIRVRAAHAPRRVVRLDSSRPGATAVPAPPPPVPASRPASRRPGSRRPGAGQPSDWDFF